jgi:putative SOS response-associated peptidase YedK
VQHEAIAYDWMGQGGKRSRPFITLAAYDALKGAPGTRGADGKPVETFAILTTTANEVLRPIHERMPVILAPADFDTWLDPGTPPEALHALLRPFPAEVMDAVAVGSYVSNPHNEGPQCLAS